MKAFLYLVLVMLVAVPHSSCKKLIEEKQKDAFLAAMTTGQWYVESYTEGTVTITEQFENYLFQFRENGTVTGTNGIAIIDGTWIGDIANYSISSNFPSAENPINKLNGLWKITNTKTGFVHAEMTTLAGKMLLELKKAQ